MYEGRGLPIRSRDKKLKKAWLCAADGRLARRGGGRGGLREKLSRAQPRRASFEEERERAEGTNKTISC